MPQPKHLHLASVQAIRTQIPPTIFETFPRAATTASRTTTAHTTSPSSHQFVPTPFQSYVGTPTPKTASSPDFTAYKIQTTTIPTASNTTLTAPRQLVAGSTLDIFAGRPTIRKLSLWTDTATLTDPLTIAEGREQYCAQWYGLPAVFSNIERLHAQVTSRGNPIEMNLKKTGYTLKGLGSEQALRSKVRILPRERGTNKGREGGG